MIEIIPAIDLIDGKCVRLTQGDYEQKKIYNENPVEVAKEFEGAGIQRLHLVDLDGAKSKHVVNYKVLENIASRTSLKIDFGGGIKSDEDIKIVFNSGAKFANIGSIAVQDPKLFEKWLIQYGTDKIILGADVKDGNVAVTGWLDVTENKLIDFVRNYTKLGVEYLLCTDISKDGMLQGSSIDMYLELKSEFPDLKIIASGGITTIDEIYKLEENNIFGAIIGKALYEGRIKLTELTKFI